MSEFGLILDGVWQVDAIELCRSTCGDCDAMSRGIEIICSNDLVAILSKTQTMQYCSETRDNYKAARCASACNEAECYSQKAYDCRYCGNWQECNCYHAYGAADTMQTCDGITLRSGIDSSCALMPRECMSHRETNKCGYVRWCMKDLCLLHNITCKVESECHKTNACIPETGFCKVVNYGDGHPCEPGMVYNIPGSGKCVDGNCIGDIDYCCKHNIQCKSENPCLESTCDPMIRNCTCSTCGSVPCDPLCEVHSGTCLFENKADGSLCSTNRSEFSNESCLQGVCLGKVTDLCSDNNVDCSQPPQCRRSGYCVPTTGECIYPPLENGDCDDGVNETLGDVCVHGTCRSTLLVTPFYELLGIGDCSLPGRKKIHAIVRSVLLESQCIEECNKDVTCEAYAWSYFIHTCKLYTRFRENAPEGWLFEKSSDMDSLGNFTLNTTHAPSSGTTIFSCYRKVDLEQIVAASMSGTDKFWIIFTTTIVVVISLWVFYHRHVIREAWALLDDELNTFYAIPARIRASIAVFSSFNKTAPVDMKDITESPRPDLEISHLDGDVDEDIEPVYEINDSDPDLRAASELSDASVADRDDNVFLTS